MKKIFLSFGNKPFYKSLERIHKEAEAMNFFDEIYTCKESDLDPEFFKRYQLFMEQTRGMAIGFGNNKL